VRTLRSGLSRGLGVGLGVPVRPLGQVETPLGMRPVWEPVVARTHRYPARNRRRSAAQWPDADCSWCIRGSWSDWPLRSECRSCEPSRNRRGGRLVGAATPIVLGMRRPDLMDADRSRFDGCVLLFDQASRAGSRSWDHCCGRVPLRYGAPYGHACCYAGRHLIIRMALGCGTDKNYFADLVTKLSRWQSVDKNGTSAPPGRPPTKRLGVT